MGSSRATRRVKSNRRKNPEWLTNLLKIDFYNSECKKHRKKYKSWFCIDCMSDPFCYSCRLEAMPHFLHRVLQVVRCSGRAAIRTEDIKKLVKVTQIQPFVINNHKIVFLQERDTKGEPMCKMCGGRMLESTYKFCSIACQVEPKNEAKAVIQFSATQEAVKNEGSGHLARRKRKGIPFRSPLF